MSKLSKLINSPLQSSHDMLLKRLPLPAKTKAYISDIFNKYDLLESQQSQPYIYAIGFGGWRHQLSHYFKDSEVVFFSRKISYQHFVKTYRWKILRNKQASQIFIWGYKVPDFILKFIEEHNLTAYFMEDGFIRSVELGSTRAPPLSITMDQQAPYFDSRKPTDIEELLNTFDCDTVLLQRAATLIKNITTSKISKYNHTMPINIDYVYGQKDKKRILVVGQVEDDASITYGCNRPFSNNDLVKLAVEENPNAEIIYKVHPDVLNGYRDYQSSPDAVRHICKVLTEDIPLANALETIDHVYTITSLSGLEALLRGIKVTTIGAPFYSSWGLTDDRQPITRRTRNRSIEELVAICYIIYPLYFDAYNGAKAEVEDIITHIVNIKQSRQFPKSNFISSDQNSLQGIYQHYTGELYQVFRIANHFKSNEAFVVYQPLFGKYDVKICPLENFTQTIVHEGIEQPKFKRVSN